MRLPTTLLLLTVASSSVAESQAPERLLNVRDMYPSISPDSTVLVFQSNRTGTNQVFAKAVGEDAEGAPTVQLTDASAGAETPVISPDGTKIALALYTAEDNNDVFVMNIDGSDLRQLTSGPGYDGHPHWSADGSRVAFNSDRTSPDPNAEWSDRWHEIFSVNVDGSDLQQHTHCETVCTYGSLSPDGTQVLYRKVILEPGLGWALEDIEKNSEIFISDLDGGNEVNLSPNPAFDGWPVWSPDGKTVAFASNRSGPALTSHIWTMNADGSELQQQTGGDWGYAQPAWSFDGKYFYAYQFVETAEFEFGSVVKIKVAASGRK